RQRDVSREPQSRAESMELHVMGALGDRRLGLRPALHRIAADDDARGSLQRLDQPEQLRRPEHPAVLHETRRKVDDAEPAARRLEHGLEDVGVLDIPLRARRPVRGAHEEAASVGIEQLAEDRVRIETRQAAPDDAAAPLYQRRELAIPNEREVLELHVINGQWSMVDGSMKTFIPLTTHHSPLTIYLIRKASE